jgi:hypothetical protein
MIMSSSSSVGEGFDRTKLESLRSGQTHQREILAWLGPPLALLRPGKSVKIDSPSDAPLHPDTSVKFDVPSAATLDYDAQFLLFAERHEPGPSMVIYYYQHLSESAQEGFVVALGTRSTTVERERLWILIDERTGRVVDFVFRED